MAAQPYEPGAEELAKVNAALEDIAAGLQSAEKAKRAGIDVTQQEAELKANQDKLLQYKQVYFPNG